MMNKLENLPFFAHTGALTCLVVATILRVSGMIPFETVNLVLEIYLGIFTFLFLMPLIPGLVEKLSNHPNRYKPQPKPNENQLRDYRVSYFGFFTHLEPGQIKITERGGRFVTCLMRYADHTFLGEVYTKKRLLRNEREFWYVVRTKDWPDAQDTHPIPAFKVYGYGSLIFIPLLVGLLPLRLPWWLWKRWVYDITGYVFTGIYPYQRVRTYPLSRLESVRLTGGKEEYIVINDYSDHHRAADVQYPVVVDQSETQDFFQLKVEAAPLMITTNAYMAAYDIDNWPRQLDTIGKDASKHFTKTKLAKEIVAAQQEDDSREFAAYAKKALGAYKPITPGNVEDVVFDETDSSNTENEYRNAALKFGMAAKEVKIPNLDPVDSESDAGTVLSGLGKARIQAESEALLAKGRRANITEQAEAIKKGGAQAYAVLKAEQQIRTAEKLDANAIGILGGDTKVDPLMAQLIKESRASNKPNQTKEEED